MFQVRLCPARASRRPVREVGFWHKYRQGAGEHGLRLFGFGDDAGLILGGIHGFNLDQAGGDGAEDGLATAEHRAGPAGGFGD